MLVVALFGVALASIQPAQAFATQPAQTQPAPGLLAWAGCGGPYECATLRVPLNHADPAGRQVELAVMRRPALDPAQRIGSLVLNPGGPGGSGIDIARAFAFALPAEVQQRFDIVGFDPRGVGKSSPLLCHDDIQRLAAIEPAPRSADEWSALQRGAQQFAGLCAQRADGVLPFLGSLDVVRDMDRLRIALGEERLTYLGYSYGTLLGALYADQFPTRVRAMVLDGPIDTRMGADELALAQASGFERAFARFLEDCRTRPCLFARRGDPAAVVDELMRLVRAKPIAAKSADRPAGRGETFLAMIAGMYRPASWRTLDRAIDNALDGDASVIVNLADGLLGRRGATYDNSSEMNSAVNCLDYTFARDPAHYQALAATAELRAPRFGRAFAASGLGCAYWSSPPQPLPRIRGAGAPPLLIIATTNDPATPFEWGLALRTQLQSSVLLTYEGDGHTAYASGNRCVNDVATRYLVRLDTPADGAICGTDPEPRMAAQPLPTVAAGAASIGPAPSEAGAAGTPAQAAEPAAFRYWPYFALGGVVAVGGLVLLVVPRLRR